MPARIWLGLTAVATDHALADRARLRISSLSIRTRMSSFRGSDGEISDLRARLKQRKYALGNCSRLDCLYGGEIPVRCFDTFIRRRCDREHTVMRDGRGRLLETSQEPALVVDAVEGLDTIEATCTAMICIDMVCCFRRLQVIWGDVKFLVLHCLACNLSMLKGLGANANM